SALAQLRGILEEELESIRGAGGTDELLGVMDQVTIINSTLGKALGGASGGYTTGPGALV
nr:glycine C-acetyltransferase (EC 2.3.1.29) - bovine (fragments) [Bos taurus]